MKLKTVSKIGIKKEIVDMFFEEHMSAEEITKLINKELKLNHRTDLFINCDFVIDIIKKEMKKKESNTLKNKIEKVIVKKEMKTKFLELYRELGFLESKREIEAKYFSFLSATI